MLKLPLASQPVIGCSAATEQDRCPAWNSTASGCIGATPDKWCGGPRRLASPPRCAITPSVALASRPTSRTRARSKSRARWRRMPQLEPPRLYDRREDRVTLDEVVKINILG